jgi:hypothetical protein
MTIHIKAAARERYALELSDADIESIHEQCRGGRNLLRRYRDGRGHATENHAVVVRGVRMPVVFKRGMALTVLPRVWLPHDNKETALAVAFRRAGLR